jgi:hypothetical protein
MSRAITHPELHPLWMNGADSLSLHYHFAIDIDVYRRVLTHPIFARHIRMRKKATATIANGALGEASEVCRLKGNHYNKIFSLSLPISIDWSAELCNAERIIIFIECLHFFENI